LNRFLMHAAAFSLLFAVTAFPVAAPAASTGLAWDSVMKLSMSTDQASLVPGSFSDDFAAASQPVQTQGGMFGKMMQGMAGVRAMMQNGVAERHYIAGSKVRTDQVAQGTAEIVDCTARTITMMDLNKKTYRVTSMDQPSGSGSSGSGGSGGTSKDDGTTVAMTIANKALGARQVNGEATNGYSSDMTFTETRPSGESHTQTGTIIGYFANFSTPRPQCSGGDRNPMGGAGPGAMMGSLSHVLQALHSAGMDKRFTVTQSGPTIPLGSFWMYTAMTFGMQSGRSGTIIMESGDVHSLDVNDPIFTVPSDFTKQQ
jgi:hypothetical protein